MGKVQTKSRVQQERLDKKSVKERGERGGPVDEACCWQEKEHDSFSLIISSALVDNSSWCPSDLILS